MNLTRDCSGPVNRFAEAHERTARSALGRMACSDHVQLLMQRLEQQLLELERQEEAPIRDAAVAGKNTPRRADANPAITLAD